MRLHFAFAALILRWRTISYNMTPAATDTFSDGTFPSMGMETRKSHFLRHQIVNALAFGAQHDGAIHVVVERVVTLSAALVQPDDPQMSSLSVLPACAQCL